jgi:hypothetical protein
MVAALQGENMSRFKAKVTEVSIYMDEDMFITTVSAPDKGLGATHDEAQIGDFHMSLFSAEEWDDLNKLITDAIKAVTENKHE